MSVNISKVNTVVIVPCYNEADRLDIDCFKSFLADNNGYAVLFVNDGSSDNTESFITENLSDGGGRWIFYP